MCVRAKLLQSCLTLCDPMDCSLPGSSVHGILQTRILKWIALPSSGDLPDPGIGNLLKVPNYHMSTLHFRKPIWGAGMQKGSPGPLAEGAQRGL